MRDFILKEEEIYGRKLRFCEGRDLTDDEIFSLKDSNLKFKTIWFEVCFEICPNLWSLTQYQSLFLNFHI